MLRSGQVRSDKVITGTVRSDQIRSAQIRLRSGQVKLDPVRSGHSRIRTRHLELVDNLKFLQSIFADIDLIDYRIKKDAGEIGCLMKLQFALGKQ